MILSDGFEYERVIENITFEGTTSLEYISKPFVGKTCSIYVSSESPVGAYDGLCGRVLFHEPIDNPNEIGRDWIWFGDIIYSKEDQKEKITMRSPEAIRQEVNEYARNIDPARLKTIPPGLKGKMVSELNKVFSSNENRRFIVGWLFTGSFANSVSTSDLTEAQIAGLLHWLQPEHQKTGWVVAPMFRQEAALVYAYVAKEHVQTASWKTNGPKMKLSPSLLAAIGVK